MPVSNLTQREADGLFGASINHANTETRLSATNTLVDGIPLAEYIDQRIQMLYRSEKAAEAAVRPRFGEAKMAVFLGRTPSPNT